MRSSPVSDHEYAQLTHYNRSEPERSVGTQIRHFHTQQYTLRRPPAGQPPTELQVVCEPCRNDLTNRVASVETVRRRRLWLALTLACVAPGIGVLVLVLVSRCWHCWPRPPPWQAVACGSARRSERGLGLTNDTGTILAGSAIDGVTLTFDRCGHREPIPPRGYLAAKRAFDAHPCPRNQ